MRDAGGQSRTGPGIPEPELVVPRIQKGQREPESAGLDEIMPGMKGFRLGRRGTRIVMAGASKRRTVLNLLQLYQHYFSRMTKQEANSSGRFNFVRLPGAWKKRGGSFPCLIYEKGKIGGFFFVRRRRLADGILGANMEEFFVLNRYRRRGVGRRAAGLAFRMLPGRWQVKVLLKNKGGRRFWRDVIAREASGPVRTRIDGDMVCHLFYAGS